MHILIIEDNILVSTHLSNELSLAGHTTAVAENGIMGLQLFSNHTFDLCIIDLLLPGNSGFEILNTIQNVWKMDTPIFVTSQLRNAEKLLKDYKVECHYFFAKPIDMLKLFQRVELLMMN
jgi:two-component system, OmpR family, copper resistance phosphate regulon response regulator CusR